MYFVKNLVIKNILSNPFVLVYSGSFDMHIGKRQKKTFFGDVRKKRFFPYVWGGGLRTLRIYPQLIGDFYTFPNMYLKRGKNHNSMDVYPGLGGRTTMIVLPCHKHFFSSCVWVKHTRSSSTPRGDHSKPRVNLLINQFNLHTSGGPLKTYSQCSNKPV